MADWHVPGYTELKTLGSGGSGDVVSARHDGSGTLVAIKYLRPAVASDAGFTRLFPTEAAVLASVDDPHVVRLYEYVRSQPGAAVVSELVDGVSLRDILARQGVTTAEAALVVLRDSLLGLAAAHRRGVAHRALKPENVLVNGDGDGKLTDFGIAVRAEGSRVPAATMVYAPPERFGGSPAGPAGDVYAATAMFYECLAGRPPFTGDTAERLVYQHLARPVPLEPVPGPLRPLVAAGLARDPRDRPADGSAFVAELTAVAASAYGLDWQERGRTHLGEAAMLLTARWPSAGAPPAVRADLFRRITGLRAAIAVGAVAVTATAGAALAVSGPGAGTTASSVAAVQRVSLQPSARKPAPRSVASSSLFPSSSAAATTSSPTRSLTSAAPASSPQRKPSASASPEPSASPSAAPSPSVTLHPPSPLPGTPPPTTSAPSPSASSPPTRTDPARHH